MNVEISFIVKHGNNVQVVFKGNNMTGHCFNVSKELRLLTCKNDGGYNIVTLPLITK